MTTLFNNRTTDGESAEHPVSSDLTTIVADGTNWERVRLLMLIELIPGGQYVPLGWEMTAPGSKKIEVNAASGLKIKLLQLGSSLTDNVPKITAAAY